MRQLVQQRSPWTMHSWVVLWRCIVARLYLGMCVCTVCGRGVCWWAAVCSACRRSGGASSPCLTGEESPSRLFLSHGAEAVSWAAAQHLCFACGVAAEAPVRAWGLGGAAAVGCPASEELRAVVGLVHACIPPW
jgi:hypothetical protein